MFAGPLPSFATSLVQPGDTPARRKTPPPPTPIKFPDCTPQAKEGSASARCSGKLVLLFQNIHRPSDVKLSHFEALGLHVLPNACPEDIIPDASFLPPAEQWRNINSENLEDANEATKKPLNNGRQSPGVKTYLEREHELSIENTAAFRTVRRIPLPPGESPARLGNAYEFFKTLDFFAGYWDDTSLPTPEPQSSSSDSKEEAPVHLSTHVRVGTGSQLPADYRQQLVTAFIKLVAYDFGCNVSFARCEPRLHVTPPSSSAPPSYFASGMSFIYRTPQDRASARSGVVEGPLAGLSCRPATGFTTPLDSHLDLAREVISILLTAQQRTREGKQETRFGEGKWWAEKKRWGGGKSGSIGREGDKYDIPFPISPTETEIGKPSSSAVAAPGPSPSKKPKKGKGGGEGKTMQIYETYRKMLPPSSTWDRKARYCAIGKIPGQNDYDDVFLISSLNHHVCVLRTRVPMKVLDVLDGKVGDGEEGEEEWGNTVTWRSRWYDLFLKGDRIEAMRIVWGMMSWLMRKVEVVPAASEGSGGAGNGDKMEIDS